MNLLKKIFTRPISVCTIVVVALAFGIFATANMPQKLLPNIEYPALAVTVVYPGASAETCDEQIRPVLDGAMKSTANVKSVHIYSVENACICGIIYDYGVNLDKKKDELKDTMAKLTFPEACYDPIYSKINFNGLAVATVSVYNAETPSATYADAQALRDKMLVIEGVSKVDLSGTPEQKIVITPHNGLEPVGLLIIQALSTNAQLNIPLGNIYEDGVKISFRNDSTLKTVNDITSTPIQIPVSKEMTDSLKLIQLAAKLLNDLSADDLRGYYDTLYVIYGNALDIDVCFSADIVADALDYFLLDAAAEYLSSNGLESAIPIIENLSRRIRNAGELDALKNFIGELQTLLSETLNEDFWNTFGALIEFRKGQEYTNPITGEVTIDDLTTSEYLEIMDILGVSLPIELTEEVAYFALNYNFDSLDFDSDGTAQLTVEIGEVASVNIVSEFDSDAYINGLPAVVLEVFGLADANNTAISKAVKEIVESNTATSTAVLLDDQSQFISDSIYTVLTSMLIGGALAIIVIFLFLRRVRTSLIIAVTMPLSVLCSLLCMYLMGISLNMVSLGGLAVGIGMLVDNSIVIIESITCERDKGKSAMQASLDGTMLVAGSLIASTLTSICVFFPILFTEGLTKMIFSDLSWAVIFSISFSLIVALAVIPTLYCLAYSDKMILKGGIFARKKDKFLSASTSEPTATEAETQGAAETETSEKMANRKNAASGQNVFMRAYDKILPFALRHRWLVLLAAFIIFAASTSLAFLTGMDFLPSVDQRTIEARIVYPPSMELEDCTENTLELYDKLSKIPEIKYISAKIGGNGILSLSNSGTIRILLNEGGRSTSEILSEVRDLSKGSEYEVEAKEIDGVLAALLSSMSEVSAIGINVYGEDVDVLNEIYEKVAEKATAADSRIIRVSTDIPAKMPEYRIKIDQKACMEYGVDYKVAVGTLRAGIAGYTACTAEIDGNTMDVNVRFKDGTLEDYYAGIENIVIGFNGNGVVTVGDVAVITRTEFSPVITKVNGKYAANISAEVEKLDTDTANRIILTALEEVIADYDGYTYEESGINLYMHEVLGGMIVALIVSFLLLFSVMACQFESLAKPFIVIFAIPLSFTGGFLALAISGLTLNVVSLVGLIMLMGVVVNDAIVMIERISQLEKETEDRYAALIAGSRSRMRAIWMTTLTTVLALIPLALAIGRGSELMQPLAIVVIGGLTLATLVTLILIPVMYSIVKRVPIPKK